LQPATSATAACGNDDLSEPGNQSLRICSRLSDGET